MFALRFVSRFKPYKYSIARCIPQLSVMCQPICGGVYCVFLSSARQIVNMDEDITDRTEDKRIIQLSHYVMNNNLHTSLSIYSSLPLFLPRSDFRIVCSLMKKLGISCGIPDLENVFSKIQRMKLTRKHALTMRCLIRLSCEIGDPKLIESFYQQICQEEIYVNNSFLNDIVMDCLFSLDAYKSICSIIDSLNELAAEGKVLPSFNNRSSQNALVAFMAEGRDDLLLFFLQRIKLNWRLPVAVTDYIASNASRYNELSELFQRCIESQPKSATLINSIIDYFTQENQLSEAISMIHQAVKDNIKVTSVSYQNTCELMVLMKDTDPPSKELVQIFCSDICSLSRGGYIVMLGVAPLEMMMLYGEIEYAVKYLELLNKFGNGLSRRDLVLLEDMHKHCVSNKRLDKEIQKVIATLYTRFDS